jgi:hypothetical protein
MGVYIVLVFTYVAKGGAHARTESATVSSETFWFIREQFSR